MNVLVLFCYYKFFLHGPTQEWNHIVKQTFRWSLSYHYPSSYLVQYPNNSVGELFDFKFHSSNQHLCPKLGEGTALLLAVESAPSHFRSRMAVRKTYGASNNSGVKVAFLLGRTPDSTLATSISKENEQFGDIIVGNFMDSYKILTLKTLSLFLWVDQYCYKAKYLVKTDDDVYVNVNNLLSATKTIENKTGVILGHIWYNSVPRDKHGKFYVPFNQYNKTKFPPYALGLGYVIHVADIEKIVKKALSTNFLWLEDVLFTGVVAESLRFKIQHNDGFIHLRGKIDCNSKSKSLIHLYGNSEWMFQLHNFQENTSLCEKKNE